ncbi:MAG: ParB/RepB/Spo0J family partition protein [Opitutales bacterium]|nr:ParB/RepB/Spo0J family partition protein [Opitutales bacterium]
MAKVSSRLGRGLGSLIAGGTAAKVEGFSSSHSTLSPVSIQKESIKNSPKRADEELVNDSDDENLFSIPIESIVPNPYQPRKIIDPDAIRELASSIESEGLLQPITARKVGNSYELVAGERRWRAHQSLGRSTILVRVLKATDISSASLSLIENLQREGLNPVEEAMGYDSLVNEFNLTQAQVADRVGKSRVHITNYLRLLQLDEELKTLIVSRKLSMGHAKVLLGVEDEKTRNQLGKRVASEGWTVRQCEKSVAEIRNPQPIFRQSSIQSTKLFSNYAKISQDSLKRKVAINCDPSGKGKLSLSFDDQTDLIDLLKSLGVSIK